MANILAKFFGNYSKRELKRIQPLCDEVLALAPKYEALSEHELRGQTAVLKERLANGETLDDILPDAFAVCREADILIAAVGRARMVDPGYVNEAQTVIDVGVNRAPDGSLCGDVDFERVEPLVGAITPVPHGVGAVTTAVLCRHVAEAAEGTVLRY